MNREKEIKGMAKVLFGHYCGNDECGKCKEPNCIDYRKAERLFNSGYGNVKQAVKEFAERLKEELWKFDGSWQEYDGEDLCETVDNLITELYGADE